jgi:hypothetical protein
MKRCKSDGATDEAIKRKDRQLEIAGEQTRS